MTKEGALEAIKTLYAISRNTPLKAEDHETIAKMVADLLEFIKESKRDQD